MVRSSAYFLLLFLVKVDSMTVNEQPFSDVMDLQNSLKLKRFSLLCDLQKPNITELMSFYRSYATKRIIYMNQKDNLDAYDHFGDGIACLKTSSGGGVEDNFGNNFSAVLSRAGFAVKNSWFFLTPETSAYEEYKVPTKVHQHAYFLNSGSLTERYEVNGIITENALEKVSRYFDGEFNFHDRRGDLKGAEIRILVEKKRPFLDILPPNGSEVTVNLPVTGDIAYKISRDRLAGIYADLFDLLAQKLNFTPVFLRKPGKKWGSQLANGTWVGSLSNVMAGDAEILGSSLTFKSSRAVYVDYLTPVGQFYNAIFIRNNLGHAIQWTTFTEPFSDELWLLLAFIVLLLTVIVKLFLFRHEDSAGYKIHLYLLNTVDLYWQIFCTHFSRGLPAELFNIREQEPLRIFLLSIVVVGNVFFMSYRASLTSELSILRYQMPFNNLEELLGSDYKLLIKGGGASETSVTKAPAGSIMAKIYEKLIKPHRPGSINPSVADSLKSVVTSNKVAYLYQLETVRDYEQYQCDLLVAWLSHSPGLNSMAFRKNSPYYTFFNKLIMTIIEDGSLEMITKKWKREHIAPKCDTAKAQDLSLGYERLASIFTLIVAGSILATVLGLLEMCFKALMNETKDVEAMSDFETELVKEKLRNLRSKLNYAIANRNSDQLLNKETQRITKEMEHIISLLRKF